MVKHQIIVKECSTNFLSTFLMHIFYHYLSILMHEKLFIFMTLLNTHYYVYFSLNSM